MNHPFHGKRSVLATLATLICILPSSPHCNAAENQARLVASPELGWPQWRGPRRDGICDETGLLPAWPGGGPKLLWKSSNLGKGYSAPILAGGRIYVTGDTDDELRLFALDMEGRTLWQSANGRAWRTPYPGARASVTYSDGRLYHMNAHGRVACFDAATGEELWGFTMFERFGGKNITWATSENLLVDGDRVIVTPGGTQALMAALDKKTGATVWQSEPLRLGPAPSAAHERVSEPEGDTDSCSYASPILVEQGGLRQIISCSLRHVFSVNADNGRLLWTRPLVTRYSVIAATPVLVGNAVFVTAPDNDIGGRLYGFAPQDDGLQINTLWTTPLDTCHGGLIFRDGTLYGSWYRRGKGWAALDAATGATRYQTSSLPQGSVLFADGRLYCLGQDGEMALINPTPDGFQFTGRFRLVPERKSDAWTHPVIHDKRLYLRYHDTLFCYDVQAQPRPAAPKAVPTGEALRLFNGKDLSGWHVECQPADRDKQFWRVENGAILCDSIGRKDHNYVWLVNDREFQDFELRLKFQAFRDSPGNSGLQFRSRFDRSTGGGWLDGPQVDIHPSASMNWRTGFIYDETREEKRWIVPSLKDWNMDPKFKPTHHVFNYATDENAWNDLVLICRGTEVKTIVNGVVVADWNGDGVLNKRSPSRTQRRPPRAFRPPTP